MFLGGDGTVPVVGADWSRLGRAVRDRRTYLGLTQDELAEVAQVSPQTIRMVEGAKQDGYRDLTYAGLERGLGWRAGSVRAVLGGGDPDVDDEVTDVLRARFDRGQRDRGRATLEEMDRTVGGGGDTRGYVSRRDALRDATKDELLEELARRIGEE